MKYDSRGNKIELVEYNSDSSIHVLISWKYDLFNNLIMRDVNYLNGIKDDSTIYKYDFNGNQIEYAIYELGNSVSSTKHELKYDSLNNKIEYAHYEYGEKLFKIKYDSNGNVTEENNFPLKGNKFGYKYNYDSKLNWVRKIRYSYENNSKKLKSITERKIEYY
tara:strand:- start:122 stop:610 length:489 start_codon:yes stop_codon:yes gene_type:complete